MAENDMPDAFFQAVLVRVRVDLVPVFDYHAVVAVELVPLIIMRVLPEPRPVELLYGLEVFRNALHIFAHDVVLVVSALHPTIINEEI